MSGPLEGGHPVAGTGGRSPPPRGRLCVVVIVRNQTDPHHPCTEEPRRVDVLAVEPHTEVERAAGHGNRSPGPDRVALGHEYGPHEPVGRAEPATVVDRDEQRSRHGPGEGDLSGGRCADGVAVRGGVLDAAIARPVGPVGRPERVEHRGAAGRVERHLGSRGRRHHGDDARENENGN